MTATTGEQTAIERYLEAVRAELADLPDEERVDMLEDVEQHLVEVAAEGDEPLESRLGPPAEYAAELRAAAGLPNRASDDDDPFAARLAARITRSRIVRSSQRLNASLQGTAAYREVEGFVPQLRPAWWVLRGYLLARLLGAATSSQGHRWAFIPEMWDSYVVGVIALLVLIPASVAWSRRSLVRPRLRWLTIPASVAIVIAALTADSGTYRAPQRFDAPYSTVIGPAGKIINIYPYASDGTPLKAVLLYDQDGRPIPGVVMDRYSVEQGYRDQNGRIVPNMFPYPEAIRDPRTGEVVGERQRPAIVLPPLMAGPTPSTTPTPRQPPSVSAMTSFASPAASPTTKLPAAAPLVPSASTVPTPSVVATPTPTRR